jgi:hypothetical protein
MIYIPPVVYNVSYDQAMQICSGFEACYSPSANIAVIGIDSKDERYLPVYWHEIGHSKLEGKNLEPLFHNNWWGNETAAWGYSDWKMGKLTSKKDQKYVDFYKSLN